MLIHCDYDMDRHQFEFSEGGRICRLGLPGQIDIATSQKSLLDHFRIATRRAHAHARALAVATLGTGVICGHHICTSTTNSRSHRGTGTGHHPFTVHVTGGPGSQAETRLGPFHRRGRRLADFQRPDLLDGGVVITGRIDLFIGLRNGSEQGLVDPKVFLSEPNLNGQRAGHPVDALLDAAVVGIDPIDDSFHLHSRHSHAGTGTVHSRHSRHSSIGTTIGRSFRAPEHIPRRHPAGVIHRAGVVHSATVRVWLTRNGTAPTLDRLRLPPIDDLVDEREVSFDEVLVLNQVIGRDVGVADGVDGGAKFVTQGTGPLVSFLLDVEHDLPGLEDFHAVLDHPSQPPLNLLLVGMRGLLAAGFRFDAADRGVLGFQLTLASLIACRKGPGGCEPDAQSNQDDHADENPECVLLHHREEGFDFIHHASPGRR